MSETALHLVDHVFPHKAVRQWVLSFPIPIRLIFAVKPKIMAEVLNITNNAISKFLTKKSGLTRKTGKTGSVTLIQRFGSALNLNVHFHQLFIDGAYELDADMRPSSFHTTPPPSRREVEEVLKKIVLRVLRLMEKRGLLIKDDPSPQLHLSDDDTFSRLQDGSAHYRFATGPNKGKKAITLHAVPDEDHGSLKGLVANISGFSLHAGVAVSGSDRKGIERIARYIARPPIALDRLSLNSKGQVVYRLKKPFSDGSTHIIMQPLELIEKLAALVPRPKIHLTRFHGVLGPHYKFRSQIVPKPQTKENSPDTSDAEPPSKGKIAWAKLLKRVFDIDMEVCQVCGAKMKVIAAIEEPPIIRKILGHLGIPSSPPMIHPPRGPPSKHDEFSQFTP